MKNTLLSSFSGVSISILAFLSQICPFGCHIHHVRMAQISIDTICFALILYKQLITEATRVTANSSAGIDPVATTSPSKTGGNPDFCRRPFHGLLCS